MWIRNAPKLRMARVTAAFRSALLEAQADLLAAGRLEAPRSAEITRGGPARCT